MADTTIACEICFKKIKEEAPLDSLCHNSKLHPKISTFPIKAELSIDETPFACNEGNLKIDEEHQVLMQNENISGNVKLPQSFPTNSSSLVDEGNYFENIKEEYVEVPIKNNDIVKEECVLFNTDVSICVEEFTASDKFYYCYHCNYSTGDKQILTNHIFTHLLKCNQRSYVSFDNSSLSRHEEVHFNVTLEENVFECRDCGYQSKSRMTLEFHVLTHKSKCNKPKNERRRLCKHSDERLFFCGVCNYKSHNKTNFVQHNKTHSQEKPFTCHICDYRSNRASTLKRHMYKHTGEMTFSCNKCDYRCDRKSHLIQHNRTHTQEKPFKCNVCNYCCSQAANLKTHMYKHTGERPFNCDKCDYRSYRKSNLILHNRTHTLEKPFKCNVCDYCCSQAVNLKKHMFKHSGDWPFTCNKCDYRCYQKNHLIRHNRTHTKEKPFKCNVCGYCCSEAVNLKKHMYKHSGERPFSCDKCHYRCYVKSNLIRHNRTHTQ